MEFFDQNKQLSKILLHCPFMKVSTSEVKKRKQSGFCFLLENIKFKNVLLHICIELFFETGSIADLV